MCTRFALLLKDYHAVLLRLGIAAPGDFASRYNLPPGSVLPAVRLRPRTRNRELAALRWGFVPGWAKAGFDGAKLANARAETLADKPSFREAFRLRRCVVPASGFYEWTVAGRQRLPWYFHRPDGRPFCLAGLWESWSPPGGPAVETCAIVTAKTNAEMRPIHNRMPLCLNPAAAEAWLDPDLPAQELAALLEPPPDGTLVATQVSCHVNNVRHDDPACLVPTPHPAVAEPELDF